MAFTTEHDKLVDRVAFLAKRYGHEVAALYILLTTGEYEDFRLGGEPFTHEQALQTCRFVASDLLSGNSTHN